MMITEPHHYISLIQQRKYDSTHSGPYWCPRSTLGLRQGNGRASFEPGKACMCTLRLTCIHKDTAPHTPFLAISLASQQHQIALDRDIQLIADYLWRKELKSPSPFVIKGSYAAAVWAQEHRPDLDLPYNDIDVFVEALDKSKCVNNKRDFLSSTYVDGVVPGTQIQITLLCKLDAKDLIRRSDINAVNVGFKVVPNADPTSGMVLPIIESWSWTPHFESFLDTKTLEVVYSYPHAFVSSSIRLLHKAQCMKMKYKFPNDHIEEMHGGIVNPHHMKKYNQLDSVHNDISSKFDLHSIPERKNWYFLALKGREDVPYPSHRLLNATTRGSNYNYGFGTDANTTSAASSMEGSVFTAVAAVVVGLMA